ncbi:MAG TPA: hypothetical protein VN521_10235 [Negativicutes bacterium]|nr:hypothetical protein [Negativicutes bacterium]
MLRQVKRRLARRGFKKARLLAAVLGAAVVLAASPPAYADQTITGPSGPVTAAGNETVTVTATGAISGGVAGILSSGGSNIVTSYGSISGSIAGIDDASSNNVITVAGGTVSGGTVGIGQFASSGIA